MTKGKAKVNYLGRSGVVMPQTTPSWDFIYEHSIIRNPRYHIGDRVVLPDGRAFRYGRNRGAILTNMKVGVKNFNTLVTENDSIVSAAAAGAKELTVTFDGEFNDVALAIDELRGGYISIYNSSAVRDQRGIIGNTAVGTGGGACTIYLDAAITVAFTSTVGCEVLGNPYSDLRYREDVNTSVMGMPCSLADTDEYYWIQTWGILRVSPAGAEYGADPNTRMLVFDPGGGLRTVDYADNIDWSVQPAGFIVERTAGNAGSAAPFIMLQISP